MKRCGCCKKKKKENLFSIKVRSTGKLQSKCKSCQRKYAAEHYVKNKEAYIAKSGTNKGLYRDRLYEYLGRHPCVDCGEADVVVLEFDHVRGEKEFAISRAASIQMAWSKVIVEIAKCDVRCANCHRRKTAREQEYRRVQFKERSGSTTVVQRAYIP